jgi:glycosyltransferase involved in cell wall biosynthesis
MDSPTWDVLIPTIPHRHEKLRALLTEFYRQWQPGLGVRVLRDNLERPGLESHAKRQELIESSAADYVCDMDDDDWPAPDYVSSIMKALRSRPDYVGFQVSWTRDGNPHGDGVARHSLEYDRYSTEAPWTRDITHLNPLRRELALLADWRGLIDEDWSACLRLSGRVKTQVMIDRVLYYYRHDTADNFYTERTAWDRPLPPLPHYPWLTVL